MSPKPIAKSQQSAPTAGSSAIASREQQLRSRDLFGAWRELLIEHGGCTYRLRITQANKLILTK